jgi:hypothetical protein
VPVRPDVSFGSKGDIPVPLAHFRFTARKQTSTVYVAVAKGEAKKSKFERQPLKHRRRMSAPRIACVWRALTMAA